jgi:membrane protein DedA with SNARE-associated domain
VTDGLSIEHLSSLVAPVAYPALVVLLLGCGVGLPLSEDLILVVAGYLVGRGFTNPWWTFIVCYPCVLAGDVLLYEGGRRLGKWPWATRRLKRVFTPARRRLAEKLFARWGVLTVAIARQIIGLRSPTFVFAGVSRMPRAEFIVTDALAGLVAVPLFIVVGYFMGRSLGRVGNRIHWIELGLVGAAILGGGLFLGVKALVRRLRKR